MIKSIDLNCDMGESFGAWRMGNDAELMNHVSSINIACGFHAGDATTIRQTIETGLAKGVAIGAHPSYPDLQGFGRREMSLSPSEVFDAVIYQVAAVKGICESVGGHLTHVKPHGALYNRAARDKEIAVAIADAVASIDRDLILLGLAGSMSITSASERGLHTANEAFADRTYQPGGSLTPRTFANAMIEDPQIAAHQALDIVFHEQVATTTGERIHIMAETICIHGDRPHAVEFAREIRRVLSENGVIIAPPTHKDK